jgi:hypothetical protein
MKAFYFQLKFRTMVDKDVNEDKYSEGTLRTLYLRSSVSHYNYTKAMTKALIAVDHYVVSL